MNADSGCSRATDSRSAAAAAESPSLRWAVANSRRALVCPVEPARIFLARRAASAGSESSNSDARMSSRSAEALAVKSGTPGTPGVAASKPTQPGESTSLRLVRGMQAAHGPRDHYGYNQRFVSQPLRGRL